jgi:uncharacterized protein (TIGR02453 family)
MERPRFEGFADTEGRFFGELTLHNDRGWFNDHRAEYEVGWLRPMEALLDEVRAGLAAAYRGIALADPKVFRIHRDVRFSKDKSPYKTHIGGFLPVARGGGRSQVEAPAALYFQVGYRECFAGAGLYGMDPDTLRRYRAAVLDPRRGAALARLASGLTRKGYTVEAREETRRVPPGVDPDHPRADLLRRKGLVVMAPDLPRRQLSERALVAALVKVGREGAPLVRWLLASAV